MTDFASLVQLEALCSSARTCRLFVERKGDSDFTEASFLGYQPQELRNWSMDGVTAFHDAVVFSFAGGVGQKVLGTYITDSSGRPLGERFTEVFKSPFEMKVTRDELEVMPRIVLAE